MDPCYLEIDELVIEARLHGIISKGQQAKSELKLCWEQETNLDQAMYREIPVSSELLVSYAAKVNTLVDRILKSWDEVDDRCLDYFQTRLYHCMRVISQLTKQRPDLSEMMGSLRLESLKGFKALMAARTLPVEDDSNGAVGGTIDNVPHTATGSPENDILDNSTNFNEDNEAETQSVNGQSPSQQYNHSLPQNLNPTDQDQTRPSRHSQGAISKNIPPTYPLPNSRPSLHPVRRSDSLYSLDTFNSYAKDFEKLAWDKFSFDNGHQQHIEDPSSYSHWNNLDWSDEKISNVIKNNSARNTSLPLQPTHTREPQQPSKQNLPPRTKPAPSTHSLPINNIPPKSKNIPPPQSRRNPNYFPAPNPMTINSRRPKIFFDYSNLPHNEDPKVNSLTSHNRMSNPKQIPVPRPIIVPNNFPRPKPEPFRYPVNHTPGNDYNRNQPNLDQRYPDNLLPIDLNQDSYSRYPPYLEQSSLPFDYFPPSHSRNQAYYDTGYGHDANHTPSNIPKWNLKFDGSKNSLSVEDFLFRVESLAQADRVSPQVLSIKISEFLQERALTWFWTYKRNHPHANWTQLKNALLGEFRSSGSDCDIRLAMHNRKQRPNELFADFSLSMQGLAAKLMYPMPQNELLAILRRNMSRELRYALLLQRIDSIEQLRDYAREYEKLGAEADNRYRNRQVSELSTEQAVTHSDYEQNCYSYIPEYQQERQINHTELVNQPSSKQLEHIPGEINEVNRNYPRQQNFSNYICWNCDERGHSFVYCTNTRRSLFCYKCGHKNVLTISCPRCNTGNQTRSEVDSGLPRSVQSSPDPPRPI